jgi:pantoate--beta-alanine ligase
MDLVTTVLGVRARVRSWRAAGLRVALVPTMGNLHAGHMSLLEVAAARADRVIVSIFVNPLQFGPAEDFTAYPRTLDEDRSLLIGGRCDLLFAPTVEQIYPEGGAQPTLITVRGLSSELCGQFRPGHFDGVTTVVAKLFNIVMPDVAVFGEKDVQQFVLIRRMTSDLMLPVEVIGAPTVRAPDGLALSSRNRFLSAQDRRKAPAIHAALEAASRRLLAGARDFLAIESAGWQSLAKAGLRPDYFAVRDGKELQLPTAASREFVVLTAARLGSARLIDNLRVPIA